MSQQSTRHPARRVLVYGATGHTGRFVVAELLRRGLTPVLAGRDAARLAGAAASAWPDADTELRTVALTDAAGLRAALLDVDAVVNCAGPFLDTALPLATAAVAAGTHYLDVSAEQPAVRAVYDRLDVPAREAGVAVIPAMAFYGGLADLMVTAALDGARDADEVTVAIGLDRWWPTAGTRVTGERNTAVRQVVREGRLVPLATPAPSSTWRYPGPLGQQAVVELPFSETVVLHRHLRLGRLTSHLNSSALADLRATDTPAPSAVDDTGRSAQRFVVDVAVRRGATTARIAADGQDIYAITAPIVVEGVARLLDGRARGVGALAPGQAFEAADVLAALGEHPAGVRLRRPAPGPAGAPAAPAQG